MSITTKASNVVSLYDPAPPKVILAKTTIN